MNKKTIKCKSKYTMCVLYVGQQAKHPPKCPDRPHLPLLFERKD